MKQALAVDRAAGEADLPLDPDEAWAAVAARDASYDGRFLFAVQTTGVYCRPGCPARRPRRENVRFFGDPAAAEAAGYRACRRCRPGEARPSAASEAVERARAYLDAHLDENVPLERLARAAFMSPWHLQRTFKRQVGLTPRQYASARRAERLKAHLREGRTVSQATFAAGFGSLSRAYDGADAHLGMTPGAYRRGGRGMRIRFAVAASPMGTLLAAATERGLCAVALGDGEAALEADLRREYPAAALERGGGEVEGWLREIVRYLEGAAREPAVPLDVPATGFQAGVWRALQAIPYGRTATYGEVAAALGRPGAARAVARACASNRVALVVPCHRVVRGDGDPSGYRWGPERKRRILRMEAGAADDVPPPRSAGTSS